MRKAVLLLAFAPCACGGGGGAAAVQTPVRLVADDVEVPPGADTAELEVRLADVPATAPVLLQVALELPAALTVAAGEALRPSQAVPTLRGAQRGDRYVVVCGDDHNAQGQPLAAGPLFRLRLQTTTPRQVGAHTARLTDLLAANSDGSAAAAAAAPQPVTVTVR